MSRSDTNRPIPMSDPRRDYLTKELREALRNDAGFVGERVIVTCVRIDGDFSELVCVIESTKDGARVTKGSKQDSGTGAK